MGLQLLECPDSVQCVEQAAVPDVQLWRFHKPLSDVGVPRGKQTDHERTAQDFEVAANRVIGNAERSTKLGKIEYLAVVVAHHYPESTQSLRWNGDPEGRDVAFQVAADEVFPPENGVSVAIGQVASREPSPKPQLAPFSDIGLVKRRWTKVMVSDPSGETLGDFLHEIWRGAAKQQESCSWLAIR